MINVELDGIDTSDYPDFTDAFISYAEHDCGRPYTEQELSDIDSSIVYELVINEVF